MSFSLYKNGMFFHSFFELLMPHLSRVMLSSRYIHYVLPSVWYLLGLLSFVILCSVYGTKKAVLFLTFLDCLLIIFSLDILFYYLMQLGILRVEKVGNCWVKLLAIISLCFFWWGIIKLLINIITLANYLKSK